MEEPNCGNTVVNEGNNTEMKPLLLLPPRSLRKAKKEVQYGLWDPVAPFKCGFQLVQRSPPTPRVGSTLKSNRAN